MKRNNKQQIYRRKTFLQSYKQDSQHMKICFLYFDNLAKGSQLQI